MPLGGRTSDRLRRRRAWRTPPTTCPARRRSRCSTTSRFCRRRSWTWRCGSASTTRRAQAMRWRWPCRRRRAAAGAAHFVLVTVAEPVGRQHADAARARGSGKAASLVRARPTGVALTELARPASARRPCGRCVHTGVVRLRAGGRRARSVPWERRWPERLVDRCARRCADRSLTARAGDGARAFASAAEARQFQTVAAARRDRQRQDRGLPAARRAVIGSGRRVLMLVPEIAPDAGAGRPVPRALRRARGDSAQRPLRRRAPRSVAPDPPRRRRRRRRHAVGGVRAARRARARSSSTRSTRRRTSRTRRRATTAAMSRWCAGGWSRRSSCSAARRRRSSRRPTRRRAATSSLRLTRRVLDRPLAPCASSTCGESIAARGADVTISEPLLEAIGERLARREQTLVLLNRRGFATVDLLPRSAARRSSARTAA